MLYAPENQGALWDRTLVYNFKTATGTTVLMRFFFILSWELFICKGDLILLEEFKYTKNEMHYNRICFYIFR